MKKDTRWHFISDMISSELNSPDFNFVEMIEDYTEADTIKEATKNFNDIFKVIYDYEIEDEILYKEGEFELKDADGYYYFGLHDDWDD